MVCLLAIAPNGARRTKEDHPNLPITAKEIGKCAKECMDAGASMIHLHVRDDNQSHTLSVERYKDAIRQIRQQTNDNIFIQVTSEAVGIYTPEQQFLMIHDLKPPAVSIGLREIRNLGEKQVNQHFIKMRRDGVFPQLILYNAVDLIVYEDWIQRGVLIGSSYPLLYVIGKAQKEGSFERQDLQYLAKNSDYHWMVCAFGEQESLVAKHAAELGGHIRLGFENNYLLENGETAQSNAELIAQMSEYLSSVKMSNATASDAQEIMKPDW